MTKYITKPIIPIFFATDDNYAPYLVVALQSIVDNSSADNQYNIYIMATTLSVYNVAQLNKFNRDNFTVEYIDVTSKLDSMGDILHLRDYYTNTTYYRLFIPSIASEYDKVLYLDCDIIVRRDIANLYNHDIGDNLVGAIVEDVMNNYDVFGTYVEKALGINRKLYFNAGILVMNLDAMRKENLEQQFVDLIKAFKFEVTQDEDYLNVLCKGRITWIEQGWNIAPIPGTELPEELVHLIHYKLAFKPWNYNDIIYQQYFWHYCQKTAYFEQLQTQRDTYSTQQIAKDKNGFDSLVAKAVRDTNDINNYRNTLIRNIANGKLDVTSINFNNTNR